MFNIKFVEYVEWFSCLYRTITIKETYPRRGGIRLKKNFVFENRPSSLYNGFWTVPDEVHLHTCICTIFYRLFKRWVNPSRILLADSYTAVWELRKEYFIGIYFWRLVLGSCELTGDHLRGSSPVFAVQMVATNAGQDEYTGTFGSIFGLHPHAVRRRRAFNHM